MSPLPPPSYSAPHGEDDTFDLPGTDVSGKGRVDPKALTAAMMTADADVEMPGRGHAGSVISNLISLSVGECFTKCVEIDAGMTLLDVQMSITEWKQKLRQSVNQSIRHAKKYDGRELSMETSQAVVGSGRLYVFVVVTRTA